MEPIIGQIMLFAGNFAPRGWAFCDGQSITISQNEALFAILGVTYGGDGRTTFALPDLRGRTPVHAGHGEGLTPRKIGQSFGAEEVALTAYPTTAQEPTCTGMPQSDGLGSQTISRTVEGCPLNNVQPSLCINYIIALQGIFPSRS